MWWRCFVVVCLLAHAMATPLDLRRDCTIDTTSSNETLTHCDYLFFKRSNIRADRDVFTVGHFFQPHYAICLYNATLVRATACVTDRRWPLLFDVALRYEHGGENSSVERIELVYDPTYSLYCLLFYMCVAIALVTLISLIEVYSHFSRQ